MPRLIDTRVEHRYREGLCCRLPESKHRTRTKRIDIRHDRKRVWIKETICVDGEGSTDENGIHHYTLLAGSTANGTNSWSIEANSLSTKQCFDLLLSLPSSARKVSFSFDYDINMMLKDIPLAKLQKLHETGYVYWHGYRIGWIPRKQFSLRMNRPASLGGTKKCVIWDMFGYFQKSFSRTLHEWQVGTEEQRRLIADMKAKRSTFSADESSRIKEYCLLECKLGAQVFDKVLEHTESLGLHLQRYDGAGSVAAAMLRLHNVRDYKNTDLPIEIALKGYYGGRFDHTAFGKIGDGYEYDINSAYPNIARSLPCLSCSKWEYVTEYKPLSIGIWNLRWRIEGEDKQWAPFPYRYKTSVGYWRNGNGWYWDSEVREAMLLYPGSITIESGYILHTNCSHKPFGFIDGYFNERKRLKESGNLAQIILKLGLNSLYGKTAQSKGKHSPPYQSFVWAGMITAGTRAMLLQALRMAEDSAVLLATDAIITTKQLPLNVGEELGQWEYKVCKNLFIVQNGVYESVGAKVATRGFAPADISFGRIRLQAAKESRFDVVVHETRFIGLGEALSRNPPLTDWRLWKEGDSRVRYGYYPERRIENGRLYLIDNPYPGESYPFQPKTPIVTDVTKTEELLT